MDRDRMIFLRWANPKWDLPQIIAIEKACFKHPWSRRDFWDALTRHKHVNGVVAEGRGEVLGFCVYAMHSTQFEILDLAVRPDSHRRGIGRVLVDSMIARLGTTRPTCVAIVGDDNLPAHLFFASCGFIAVHVHHSWWRFGEDAYEFHSCGATSVGRSDVRRHARR